MLLHTCRSVKTRYHEFHVLQVETAASRGHQCQFTQYQAPEITGSEEMRGRQ